jgi:hypothetical protein
MKVVKGRGRMQQIWREQAFLYIGNTTLASLGRWDAWLHTRYASDLKGVRRGTWDKMKIEDK